MKRGIIGLVLFFCLALPFAASAEQATQTQTSKTTPSELERDLAEYSAHFYVEWLAIKAVGGLYGGGVGLDAFTLHWKWFFWEIVHSYPFIGGAKPLQKPYDPQNSFMTSMFIAGTMIGVPFAIGETGRHEIRLGLGFLAGPMDYGNGLIYSAPMDDGRISHGSFGPEIEFAVSYIYRVYPHLALEAGLSVIVATRSDGVFMGVDGNTSEIKSNLPWPAVQAFAGLRF